MPKRFQKVPVLALTLIVSATAIAQAGRFNRKLDVGDAAPGFENVDGVDNAKHSLDTYQDAKAVVFFFTCNHCPFAQSMEERIIQLQKDYEDKGVQLVAISVSPYDEDKLEPMKKHAKERGFNFPYLYDESQEVGRAWGARATPEFFLLDGDRNIAYMGSMDDGDLNRQPEKHYLRDAIDAVLAGSEVAKAETKPRGCSIQYQ